jgi:putative DNA primase/helicase
MSPANKTVPILENIPDELKDLNQFVVWRNEERDGELTKVPYQPAAPERRAKSNDPATWSALEIAHGVFSCGPWDGIGFVFSPDDPYSGIDFDGCLVDGNVAEWAWEWIAELLSAGAYGEISPSGKGIKFFCLARLPGAGGKRTIGEGQHTGIEIYDRSRYFAVTGEKWSANDLKIGNCQAIVDRLYAWVKESRNSGHQNGQSETPKRESSAAAPDVEKRAREYARTIDPAISGQNGHSKTFYAACKIGPGFDLPPDLALRIISEEYNPQCQPPWSQRELEHKIDSAYERESRRGWLLQSDGTTHNGGHQAGNRESLDAKLAKRMHTDLGNGERLVARHGTNFRYCHPWKKPLVWDGARWSIDQTAMMFRKAKHTVRRLYAEAATLADDDERKAALQWGRISEGRERISAMIDCASKECGIPVLPEHLDSNRWLLNTQNGTINLNTGALRPHRREDLITALSPVVYDPSAQCPTFLQTLNKILEESEPLIRFLQRLFGLFLTGEVSEQILPIFYGTGANGKSTLINVILELLGADYATMAPPGLLVAKRGETHPTERAILFGKRLVVDMESAEGARLNENFVKQVTGSDKLSVRRMREDFWDFWPTHKVLLCTNHKPQIRESKEAIWRRIRLIPFSVRIPDEEQDKTLPRQLRAEYPGILAWCVQGCLDWQREGLGEPEEVMQATSGYRDEQDILGAFLDEHTIRDLSVRVRCGHLYERYKRWAEAASERVTTLRAFGEAMKERGIETIKSDGKWYLGVALRDLPPGGENEF